MKIAVNTRLLIPNKLEGIGWFTYETLHRITRNHPEHQFYFIFDRPYSPEFIFCENVTPIVIHPQARHPFLWHLYFEYSLPRLLKKLKPDLFLSTDGWMPACPNIKSVNVIHDLNFEHHPEFIKPIVQKYYKRYFHQFAERADRIATVSEFTKQDIHQLYHIPLEKIDVVYNGMGNCFAPLDENQQKEIRAKYSQDLPYFVFVGLIHKRKNLDNIFLAFDQFKENDQKKTKLLIVGEKKWWKGDIENTFLSMKHQNDVIFLGRQPAEVLSQLMAASVALVYPSLFEGFGIPIIEAFACETAVITSNLTSMPEVAGDAALLINPYHAEEISLAMHQLSTDANLRQTLIEKGREQRKLFSWDLTAERLWSCLEKVMNM